MTISLGKLDVVTGVGMLRMLQEMRRSEHHEQKTTLELLDQADCFETHGSHLKTVRQIKLYRIYRCM